MNTNFYSFVYNFDMGDEIAHFKHMPEHIQSSAECNAVDVIYESFVVPGDQDYLMSRLLARNGLPRGFYWAAAQATEKYLKAFLLLNGMGVREYKAHPIKELFKAACSINISLTNLNIQPHEKIDSDSSPKLEKFAIEKFIDDLEKHGCSDNRYNAFGVEYGIGHLYAMDSLAFQLRGMIGAAPINESFNKLTPELVLIFEGNNPWFHAAEKQLISQITTDEIPIQYSSSVTKLEIILNNEKNPAYGLALQWLRKKMKIPK